MSWLGLACGGVWLVVVGVVTAALGRAAGAPAPVPPGAERDRFEQ
jgi:hypothetical protein